MDRFRDGLASGLVAMSVMGMLWFLAWALVFHAIPAENREPLLMLIGVVSNASSLIVGFYFGSTIGSRRKDSAVAAALDVARPAQHDVLTIPPGDRATATATESGTVIRKEHEE